MTSHWDFSASSPATMAMGVWCAGIPTGWCWAIRCWSLSLDTKRNAGPATGNSPHRPCLATQTRMRSLLVCLVVQLLEPHPSASSWWRAAPPPATPTKPSTCTVRCPLVPPIPWRRPCLVCGHGIGGTHRPAPPLATPGGRTGALRAIPPQELAASQAGPWLRRVQQTPKGELCGMFGLPDWYRQRNRSSLRIDAGAIPARCAVWHRDCPALWQSTGRFALRLMAPATSDLSWTIVVPRIPR